MPLPYEKLTQILGIEASDYPPEHETTPEFMNKKFNELLLNDKELLKQINDCFKFKGDCNNPDDCSESGIYRITSKTVNNPLGSGVWGMLIVLMNPDGNAITQKAIRTVDGQLGYVEKSRTSYFVNPGRAWGAWQQIATIEQIGTTKVATISNSQMYNGWSNQIDDEWARVSVAERNKILQIRVYVVNGVDTSSKAFDLPEGFSYVWTENDWLIISGREVYFKKTQIMPSVATFVTS